MLPRRAEARGSETRPPHLASTLHLPLPLHLRHCPPVNLDRSITAPANSVLFLLGTPTAAATMANQTVPMNSDSRVRARVQVALRPALRNIVQAAAENTNTFATMTGDALINTPYSTQSAAPNI